MKRNSCLAAAEQRSPKTKNGSNANDVKFHHFGDHFRPIPKVNCISWWAAGEVRCKECISSGRGPDARVHILCIYACSPSFAG
ncbi:sestrin-2 [Anopheles sinensis]|uniref:Sestrin-2 n=1 Tax=Anopheles sinensis TaxID=74873 RepID=A0A084VIX6_ANOSI|nr:sestrin-2 [Anopheles sinensis]